MAWRKSRMSNRQKIKRTLSFSDKEWEDYGYILHNLKQTDHALRTANDRFDACRSLLLDIKANKKLIEAMDDIIFGRLVTLLALFGVQVKMMPKIGGENDTPGKN